MKFNSIMITGKDSLVDNSQKLQKYYSHVNQYACINYSLLLA